MMEAGAGKPERSAVGRVKIPAIFSQLEPKDAAMEEKQDENAAGNTERHCDTGKDKDRKLTDSKTNNKDGSTKESSKQPMSERPEKEQRAAAADILNDQLELYPKTKDVWNSNDLGSKDLLDHVKQLEESYDAFNDMCDAVKREHIAKLLYPFVSGSLDIVCDILTMGLEKDAYFTEDGQGQRAMVEVQAKLLFECLLNLCDFTQISSIVRDAVVKHGKVVPAVVKKLDDWHQPHMDGTLLDIEDQYVKKGLTVVLHLSLNNENTQLDYLRQIDGFFATFQKYLQSKNDDYRLIAIATLANVAKKAQAEDITAEKGIIHFLLDQIKQTFSESQCSSSGWTLFGLCKVVKMLAQNDANKQLLVKEGALPLLVEGMKPQHKQHPTSEEKRLCLKSLWQLSFDAKNREEMIKQDELLASVVAVYKEGPDSPTDEQQREMYRSAEGILFQLRDKLRQLDKYKDIGRELTDFGTDSHDDWTIESSEQAMSERPEKEQQAAAADILNDQLELYLKTEDVWKSKDLGSKDLLDHVEQLRKSYAAFNDMCYAVKFDHRGKLYNPFLSSGSLDIVCDILTMGLEKDAYFTVDDLGQRAMVEVQAELLGECLLTLCSFTNTSSEVCDAVVKHGKVVPAVVKKLDDWHQPHMDGTLLGNTTSEPIGDEYRSSVDRLHDDAPIRYGSATAAATVTGACLTLPRATIRTHAATENGSSVDRLSGVDNRAGVLPSTPSPRFHPISPTSVPDIEAKYVRHGLSVVHLLSSHNENTQLDYLRQIDGFFAIFQKYLQSKNNGYRLTAIATLANVAKEAQAKEITAEKGIIHFLLDQIKQTFISKSKCTVDWTLFGLCKVVKALAQNDANKQLLVKEGALPLLVEGMKPQHQMHNTSEVKRVCLESLWLLSFDAVNLEDAVNREEMMKQDELLESVVAVYKEGPGGPTDEQQKKMYVPAEGILFQLRDKLRQHDKYKDIANKLLGEKATSHVQDSVSHVMMSYQTQHRPVVKKVCDFLKENDLKMWMDIYDMSKGKESTLQTMAEAVEGSAVVLMCVSETYKNSAYCRAEAEYAFMKKKDIIPLKLQKGYDPDGWLGIIQGSKFYYDFTHDERDQQPMMQQLLEDVVKAMGGVKREAVSKQGATINNGHGAVPHASFAGNGLPLSSVAVQQIRQWGTDHVTKWLHKFELEGESLKALTGLDIVSLRRMYDRAPPECFYQLITGQLGLEKVTDVSKLAYALEELYTHLESSD